jgi:hypothetical protein
MASAVPRYQSSPGCFPALAQVLQQGLALELNQHVNRIDTRVHQVAEYKVGDPIASPKRNGRFGALLGQRIQTSSFASRQDKRKYAQLHRATLRQHSFNPLPILAEEAADV